LSQRKAWQLWNGAVFIAIVHLVAALQLLKDVPARYTNGVLGESFYIRYHGRPYPPSVCLEKGNTSLNAILHQLSARTRVLSSGLQ
jgi:hypothetical protein